jgi:hypothetical protein
MSDLTKALLDEAIQNHLADEQGVTLTGWIVIAKGKNVQNLDENTTRYIIEHADGTDYDVALGLAHYAVLTTESDFSKDGD